MRDGVHLATDVYLPDGPGPFPAVLVRLPYDKNGRYCWIPFLATHFVARGYAFVPQDVRGRFRSEGEPVAFVNEVPDGYDTIDWIARQPWSNGDVGMWGDSYYGFTQWAAVASGHPALKAIVPRTSWGRTRSRARRNAWPGTGSSSSGRSCRTAGARAHGPGPPDAHEYGGQMHAVAPSAPSPAGARDWHPSSQPSPHAAEACRHRSGCPTRYPPGTAVRSRSSARLRAACSTAARARMGGEVDADFAEHFGAGSAAVLGACRLRDAADGRRARVLGAAARAAEGASSVRGLRRPQGVRGRSGSARPVCPRLSCATIAISAVASGSRAQRGSGDRSFRPPRELGARFAMAAS